MAKLKAASSIEINNKIYNLKARGKKITVLSLGESFFELPNFNAVVGDEDNHYIDTFGYLPLRKKVVSQYERYGVRVGADSVLVTAGAKLAIFECLAALRDFRGALGRVGFLEPGWVSYPEQVVVAGGQPIAYQLEDFSSVDTDGLDAFIINNPHNPTGYSFSIDELDRFFEKCKRSGTVVIFDEVYSEFAENFVSGGRFIDNEGSSVMVVNSFSKNFGASGWRLGYVLTSTPLLTHLKVVHQHLLTCAPVPVQRLAAEYFDAIVEVTRPQIASVLRCRREVVRKLESVGFNVFKGDATFYIFAAYPDVVDAAEFLDEALECGVSFVPGRGYGETYSNYIRLSVGTEASSDILSAVDVLAGVFKKRI